MPLAKRIIPCLDVKNGRVVKGIRFRQLRDAGDPVEQAVIYEEEGADELVFLDITASCEKRKTVVNLVRRVAEELSIPFTVGGGISSREIAREVLCSGADKVSVNTAAVLNPNLITELARVFGSQCVIVAIDAKRKPYHGEKDRYVVELPGGERVWWEVYIYSGTKPTGMDAVRWAVEVVKRGAGEILLTSMDMDGTMNGYDIPLTRAISENVDVPVIASGGAGNPQHIYEALTIGKAEAALAASIFHYGYYPIKEVKKYLLERGVNVRPC